MFKEIRVKKKKNTILDGWDGDVVALHIRSTRRHPRIWECCTLK